MQQNKKLQKYGFFFLLIMLLLGYKKPKKDDDGIYSGKAENKDTDCGCKQTQTHTTTKETNTVYVDIENIERQTDNHIRLNNNPNDISKTPRAINLKETKKIVYGGYRPINKPPLEYHIKRPRT